MKNGFVKVAAATPDIRVADVEFNTQNIINAMEEAQKNGAKILVFPELCVTGYTCSDLFDHSVLLKASRKALLEIAENTNDKDMLVFVGAPLEVNGKLYNVAAAMNQDKLFIIPSFCTSGANTSLPTVIPPKNSDRYIAERETVKPRCSLP